MGIPNHSNREIVAEEFTSKGCYRLEKIYTKKKNKLYGPYGPYWYFYYYHEGKLHSKYIGRVLNFKIHSKKELETAKEMIEEREVGE